MIRPSRGTVICCLAMALSQPQPGLAQSQDAKEQPVQGHRGIQEKSRPGEATVEGSKLVIGRGRSGELLVENPKLVIGHTLSADPNSPWSGAVLNSFSSIGFHMMNDEVRTHLRLGHDRGLIVARVEPNSPEHAMGIRANDVILTLGNTPIASPADFLSALKKLDDQAAPLVVLRNGTTETIQAQPRRQYGLSPAKSERTIYMIGVTTSPVDPLLRAHLKLPAGQGVAVRNIDSDGPASKIKLAVGDILLSVNEKSVGDEQTLYKLIQENGEKTISLEVIHEGDKKTLRLVPDRKQVETLELRVAGEDARRIHLTLVGSPAAGDDKRLQIGTMSSDSRTGSMSGGVAPQRDGSGILLSGNGQNFNLNLKPGTQANSFSVNLSDPNRAVVPGQPTKEASDSVAKRLDTMKTQIDSLQKAVEELTRSLKDKK